MILLCLKSMENILSLTGSFEVFDTENFFDASLQPTKVLLTNNAVLLTTMDGCSWFLVVGYSSVKSLYNCSARVQFSL